VRVKAAPRADATADVVAQLGPDGRLRHVRDETYLLWRYRDPLHEYRFLVQGADRLRGYLVLQAHRAEPERGIRIVDYGPLTALGFVPTSSGSQLRGVAPTMIRPVGRAPAGADPIPEGQRLLDLASWDMRMIYSMAG
jgi:hypothetical protein